MSGFRCQCQADAQGQLGDQLLGKVQLARIQREIEIVFVGWGLEFAVGW
jgi:hypothetical protein